MAIIGNIPYFQTNPFDLRDLGSNPVDPCQDQATTGRNEHTFATGASSCFAPIPGVQSGYIHMIHILEIRRSLLQPSLLAFALV